MIFFMVYCFFFIFLSKFSLKNSAMSSWRHLSYLIKLGKSTMTSSYQFSGPTKKEKKGNFGMREYRGKNLVSLLDLPELALDLILEKLEPKTLCKMTGVCGYLREKCVSDYLWERHMKQKWGRHVGDAANREWKCHIATTRKSTQLRNRKHKMFSGSVSSLWPLQKHTPASVFGPIPEDSIMAMYLALETGKFWFPAQVYNREVQNGNIGFMLSCYDADLGYNSNTDSFKARYSPQGRSTVEYDVGWDRVRPPAVDTPSHSLHTSGCLDDLAPGDHIEIQWRRNKDFPCGWWYGVVGHLKSCDENRTYCQCHNNEIAALEFKQYTPGSRWRLTEINRKEHREIGNEADGFHGGIRKLYLEDEISLYLEDEISIWRRIWQTPALE